MKNTNTLIKKIWKTIRLATLASFIIFSVFSINYPVISLQGNLSNTPDNPIPTAVAGSEMYSEQLSAYVAGDTSIIKQGYITNDSNVLKGFNYDDPAFHECSVLIASSNGITPEMFPSPFGESAFGSEKFLTYDCFYGFLYYGPPDGKTIADRATRALHIIETIFNIQLFMTDTFDEDYFYPFFGFYPNWDDYFELIIENAPQDGYWGAIDSDRLLSEEYLTQKHISSYILMLDSVGTLADGFDFPEGFEKYEIDYITTSFADVSEISSVFSGVFDLLNFTSGGFNIFGTEQLLQGDSKFITTILQYEGAEEGLERISGDEYNFDLMKSLNYDVTKNGPLAPSSKVYISLVGAMLSEIDVSIYSSDIISFTPLYNTFSNTILDSIVQAAFLLGQNLDISLINNYSLRTFWRTDDAVNRIVTNIYDHATPENPLNLLTTLSLTGLPVIPTGLLNPLSEFTVQFVVNSTEPVLRIEKDYRFLSYDTGEYELDISVTNVGDIAAWGRKIEFPVLNQTFLPIPDVITDFIFTEYNMTATEFLIPEEEPRFIFIDSLGFGTTDYLYPEITDLTQLTFYNPEFAENILNTTHDDYFNSSGVTQEQREIFADLFNQSNSIFHEANWKLDPGETITYTLTDLSLESSYNYASFYEFNFTISGDGLEPYLSYGNSIPPSDPINATEYNDATWDIMSEQIGLDNLIQVYFSFENTSTIDLYNYSYDQIGLDVLYSSNLNLPLDAQFILEFYNTSSMAFDVISETSYSVSDTAIEFLTPSNILDFVNPTNDYQSIFKLTFTSDSTHILSLEQVKVQFYDRNLGIIMQNPATVTYSTYTGHNTYFIDSNPIPSVSDPAPILSATAELGHYASTPGMLNSYNLTIENVGDIRADAVNITLKAPGIIADSRNFSLSNGYLYFSISNIDVGALIQNLTFSFYTPNSNNLPLADIEYNHPISVMNATHPDFISHTNDLFLSAPIDYSDAAHSPYLYVLQFSYESNYSSANLQFGEAPEVGDVIRVDLIVENLSPLTLSDLNCTIPDYIVGFDRLDNLTAEFLNIEFGEIYSQSYSTDVNKTYWDSIMFPGVDLFNSSQKYMIQIARKCPLVLGYKDFEIQKSFSDFDATTNSIVTVQINVTNTGNLHAYDLNVHDFAGYPKEGFSLMSGTPDKHIASLAPSETFIYSYTLKFNKQGTYEITPASLEYDYISQQTAYSDPFTVKVRNYWFVNALYVIIPSIVGGIATGLIYWSKKRYDMEAAEFSRREELMFGQDFRSVAWNKRTLQEDLFDLNNPDKTQSKEDKKI